VRKLLGILDGVCPICGEPLTVGSRRLYLWLPQIGKVVFHKSCFTEKRFLLYVAAVVQENLEEVRRICK